MARTDRLVGRFMEAERRMARRRGDGTHGQQDAHLERRTDPEAARAHPGRGVPRVQPERLSGRRGRRHRARGGHLQGRHLLPLPDQGIDLRRVAGFHGRPARSRKVERTVDTETEPVARASAAIAAVLAIFSGHRSMARLLLIDGLGSGAMFRVETLRLHDRFAALIASYLDGAVAEGAIPPLDTPTAGVAWFGAIHELVVRWLVADRSGPARGGVPDASDAAAAERRRARGPDRGAGRGVGRDDRRGRSRDGRRTAPRRIERGACGSDAAGSSPGRVGTRVGPWSRRR